MNTPILGLNDEYQVLFVPEYFSILVILNFCIPLIEQVVFFSGSASAPFLWARLYFCELCHASQNFSMLQRLFLTEFLDFLVEAPPCFCKLSCTTSSERSFILLELPLYHTRFCHRSVPFVTYLLLRPFGSRFIKGNYTSINQSLKCPFGSAKILLYIKCCSAIPQKSFEPGIHISWT